MTDHILVTRDVLQAAVECIDWYETHLREHHRCLHTDEEMSGIPKWERKVFKDLRALLDAPCEISTWRFEMHDPFALFAKEEPQ